MSFKQFGGIDRLGQANEIKTNQIISDYSYSDNSVVNSELSINGYLKVASRETSEFVPLNTTEGGTLVYNTTIDQLLVWDGNQWTYVGTDPSLNGSYWELSPSDNSIEYNNGNVIIGSNDDEFGFIAKQKDNALTLSNFYTPSNFNSHTHNINIKKITPTNDTTCELLIGGHYHPGEDSTTYIQSRDTTFDPSGTNPHLSYQHDLLLNPLGGNVGIGVIDAGESLDISGNIRTNGSVNWLSPFDGGQSFSISIDSSRVTRYLNDRGYGGHLFQTNTGGNYVDALFINHSGEVGIGTTTPTHTLDVSGDAIINGDISTRSNLVMFSPYNGGQTLSISIDSNNITRYLNDRGNGGHLFQTNTGGNYVDALFINHYGEVGIGTTTPTRILDVSGEMTLNLNNIINVKDPINAQDVATKNYVDTHPGVTVDTGTSQTQLTNWTNNYYYQSINASNFKAQETGQYRVDIRLFILPDGNNAINTSGKFLEFALYDISAGSVYFPGGTEGRCVISGSSIYQAPKTENINGKNYYSILGVNVGLVKNQQYNVAYKYPGNQAPTVTSNSALIAYFTKI